jgi:hypothetical protein
MSHIIPSATSIPRPWLNFRLHIFDRFFGNIYTCAAVLLSCFRFWLNFNGNSKQTRSQKPPIKKNSPPSFLAMFFNFGCNWNRDIMGYSACLALCRCHTMGLWEKGKRARGELQLGFCFIFFNSDGGSLYTILYSNHNKKFNIRQAACVYRAKDRHFCVRVSMLLLCISLSLAQPKNGSRLG